MILYFAVQPSHIPYLEKGGVQNILISYLYGMGKILQVCQALRPEKVLVDSGAFTAWTLGQKIDLKKYAEFCLELKSRYEGEIRFVNLDVIPGGWGRKPTKLEVEDSAKRGWENLEYLESKDVSVMHVFHQYEDFKWLEKLAKREDYFGVSPVNDIPAKKRMIWLNQVFAYLKGSKKTHGFGVTARRLLYQYPWYSVDSTSWLAPIRYGSSCTINLTPRGLGHKPGYFMKVATKGEVKRWLQIEKDATELWRRRGLSWQG